MMQYHLPFSKWLGTPALKVIIVLHVDFKKYKKERERR
jgi:hypothetical protein